MFGAGLVCLLLRRHIGWHATLVEVVGTSLGAALIIGTHVLNLTFSRSCQCCEGSSEVTDAEAQRDSNARHEKSC